MRSFVRIATMCMLAAISCGGARTRLPEPAPAVIESSTPPSIASAPPGASPPSGPRGDVVDLFIAGAGVCARFQNGSAQCAVLDRTPVAPFTAKVEQIPRWSSVAGVAGRCAWRKDGTLACADVDPRCGTLTVHYPAAETPKGIPCAALSDGNVSCTKTIDCAPPSRLRGVVSAVASDQVCARTSDGAVMCADPYLTELATIASARGAIGLAASRWESCAILPDGRLSCWENGTRWYLQNEAAVATAVPTKVPLYSPTPHFVPDLRDVASVALGDNHSCAVLTDHSVRCWGENTVGQLGDATTTENMTPVRSVGITDAEEVQVGSSHSCARLRDGTVSCWGEHMGATADGNGHHKTPTRITGQKGVRRIATGGAFTCALTNGADVDCWGCAVIGRCGLGYTEADAARDRKEAERVCRTLIRIPWLP